MQKENRNHYKPTHFNKYMGDALVKIKILPTSPEVDFEELKEKTKKILETKGGKNCSFEEEPIAFGLKALIVSFVWPEQLELEDAEEEIKTIEEVSSEQVIDMRRAIG